jgi:hypothetical protein
MFSSSSSSSSASSTSSFKDAAFSSFIACKACKLVGRLVDAQDRLLLNDAKAEKARKMATRSATSAFKAGVSANGVIQWTSILHNAEDAGAQKAPADVASNTSSPSYLCCFNRQPRCGAARAGAVAPARRAALARNSGSVGLIRARRQQRALAPPLRSRRRAAPPHAGAAAADRAHAGFADARTR